jgi:formamidopyrimidine-DNA glycosylase
MPEMIEVEAYRRVAERAVGRTVGKVDAPDDWYLKGGTTARALRTALKGVTVTGTDRIGKLLLLETDGPRLGLRFGMTGRLLVDGTGPIEKLEYGSSRNEPEWNRFGLRFAGGGSMEMIDPRRLGGVSLDPSLDHLGPDAMRITKAEMRAALHASRAPLKAWLLTQSHVAGVGNLLADETLWQAGFDPTRAGGSLTTEEVDALHRQLRKTITMLTRRGGSHTGDLQVARVRGATCPRDGTRLNRQEVGGRTTYWCPLHQR